MNDPSRLVTTVPHLGFPGASHPSFNRPGSPQIGTSLVKHEKERQDTATWESFRNDRVTEARPRYRYSGREGLSREREVCYSRSCCGRGVVQGRSRGIEDTEDSDQSVSLGVTVISNPLGLHR